MPIDAVVRNDADEIKKETAMSAIRVTDVFAFSELDERAQQRAIDHYRNNARFDDFDAECIIDEWAEELAACGVDCKQRSVTLMSGQKRSTPDVFYSIGWAQSDGVSFGATVALPAWLKSQKLAGKYRAFYNAACGRTDDISVDAHISHGRGYTTWPSQVTINCYGWFDDRARAKAFDTQVDAVEEALSEWVRDKEAELYDRLSEEISYRLSDESIRDWLSESDDACYTVDGDSF